MKKIQLSTVITTLLAKLALIIYARIAMENSNLIEIFGLLFSFQLG